MGFSVRGHRGGWGVKTLSLLTSEGVIWTPTDNTQASRQT